MFTNWLYPALFEMARWPDFELDPEWIAARIRPTVPVDEVAEAVSFMKERGLLGEGASARFAEVGQRLSSGHEVKDAFRGHLLARYHQATLDLLKQRLIETTRPSRHYVTMTFAADESTVEDVKRQIRSVIEQASASATACESPSRVMVLGIQLVPVAGDPDQTELSRRE